MEGKTLFTLYSELKQIVPSEVCLACDVCCRFPEKTSPLRPYFAQEERSLAHEKGLEPSYFPGQDGSKITVIPYDNCHICPNFIPETHECRIYDVRPLDCRIYPFTIMKNPAGEKILLGMDLKCPYIRENAGREHLQGYSRWLASFCESDALVELIAENPGFIQDFQEDCTVVGQLPRLTNRLKKLSLRSEECHCEAGEASRSNLKTLTLHDKPLVEQYLAASSCSLSACSFPALFIWQDILPHRWTVLEDCLCVFTESPDGLFMPLPPLGDGFLERAVREAFRIMDGVNVNTAVSRIENVEESRVPFFASCGLQAKKKGCEYLYLRSDLISLSGNRYKGKRSAYNQFLKGQAFIYEPYQTGDREASLTLFSDWKKMRQERSTDSLSLSLLEDAASAHRQVLDNHEGLGITGRVVRVNGAVRGYTFGYPLKADTFCIVLEITDLRIKGLSQFLFREFCRELTGYQFVNAGDDSGLENLRHVKLSYRPHRIIPTYIITR